MTDNENQGAAVERIIAQDTATDDEREAREVAWQEYLSKMRDLDAQNNLAGRGMIPSHRDWHAGWNANAAGRSEVPEPSAEDWEPVLADVYITEAERALLVQRLWQMQPVTPVNRHAIIDSLLQSLNIKWGDSAPEQQGEPSDAQEAVRRLRDSGVGAYMILAAVTKVYDMETKP